MYNWVLERWAAFIMGVILTATSLGNIYWGAHGWPKAEGYVVESYVKPSLFGHETVIKYAYDVNGQEYTSKRLMTDWSSHYESSKEQAVKIVSSYFRDQEVTVYYDPTNPHKATLGLYFGRYSVEKLIGFFVYAFLFLLFGFAFGLYSFEKEALGRRGQAGRSSLIARDLEPK